jgi:hypothetical protein
MSFTLPWLGAKSFLLLGTAMAIAYFSDISRAPP